MSVEALVACGAFVPQPLWSGAALSGSHLTSLCPRTQRSRMQRSVPVCILADRFYARRAGARCRAEVRSRRLAIQRPDQSAAFQSRNQLKFEFPGSPHSAELWGSHTFQI